MSLVKGLSTTRASSKQPPPSKDKLSMWRREHKLHCKTLRKHRLSVPTFEEFVERVHGIVDISESVIDQPNDQVLTQAKNHRNKFKSIEDKQFTAPKRSIIDPRTLADEPEHVRNEILAKSKRTAPAYSKGPSQYITDGTDKTEIGRKL